MDFRPTTRALLASLTSTVICLLAPLALAGSPGAETARAWSVPSVTITESGLSRADAPTGSGQAFVLQSSVETTVIVQFDLQEGQRVACAMRGRTPRLAEVFTLSKGSALVCHARAGRYEFTAHRRVRLASGASRLSQSMGWIEVS